MCRCAAIEVRGGEKVRRRRKLRFQKDQNKRTWRNSGNECADGTSASWYGASESFEVSSDPRIDPDNRFWDSPFSKLSMLIIFLLGCIELGRYRIVVNGYARQSQLFSFTPSLVTDNSVNYSGCTWSKYEVVYEDMWLSRKLPYTGIARGSFYQRYVLLI